MKIRMMTIFSIVCMLVSVQLFAESALVDKYSDSELIKILKEDGYSSVEQREGGLIAVKVDGSTLLFVNMSDGDLQGYYSISGADISYEEINEWNKTKRLSRAYLDSDQDPVLESDLLSNGGVAEKHVTEFIRVFLQSTKAFREFVVEHHNSKS